METQHKFLREKMWNQKQEMRFVKANYVTITLHFSLSKCKAVFSELEYLTCTLLSEQSSFSARETDLISQRSWSSWILLDFVPS